MDNINSIPDAFEAMKRAYETFIAEAEAFIAEQKERQMNLPPTLGHTNTQDNGRDREDLAR